MSQIELVLSAVADELEWLEVEPVFLGGATLGLFVDQFARAQLRPTDDVDCIVPEIASRRAWWLLEEQLRNHGWSPDPAGPICRYRSPSGTTVDLMAEDPQVLGFAGKWYHAAVANAERRPLVTGRTVRVPPVEYLLGCKLEAWQDRGLRDPFSSKDLEDIVALLDGCRELGQRIMAAAKELRDFVAVAFQQILESAETMEVALGQLPRGEDIEARERRLVATMKQLATESAVE